MDVMVNYGNPMILITRAESVCSTEYGLVQKTIPTLRRRKGAEACGSYFFFLFLYTGVGRWAGTLYSLTTESEDRAKRRR